jgi:hypothetical protein
MSARRRLWTAWGIVSTLVMLPTMLLEEFLHALAALPFAEEVSVHVDPRGSTAKTRVQYAPGTPSWAVTFAHVAPEVVAAVAGVAVIAWWTVGGTVPIPQSTTDWVLLLVLGMQYLWLLLPEQRAAGGGDDA